MNRTEKFIKNTLSTGLLQIITMISGFIVPKVMLVFFGSEVNGVVTSITQFISYLTLLEAGLSGATTFSLYKPIAVRDTDAINRILVAAKNLYYKTGHIFSCLVVLCAIIYPFLIHSTVLNYDELFCLFIILGVNGVLEFYTLAKYRALLTADQKTYIISLASIVQVVLNIVIVVSLAYAGYSVVVVRGVAVLAIFARTYILWFYCRHHYKFLDFTVPPNNDAMKKRWDALYLQVLGAIHQGAPILIATFCLSLIDVSIYAIYNLVIIGVNSLFGIFMSGLAAGFGDLIARREEQAFHNAFSQFEFVYYIIITIAYSTMLFTYVSFISIYTHGSDVSYYYPIFAFLLILNGLAYNIKNPFGMLVFSTGKYKETRMATTIQGMIELFGGIVLSLLWGLNGLVIASILSNVYRDIEFLFFAPNNLTHIPAIHTIKLWLINIGIFAVFTVISMNFMDMPIINFKQWAVYTGIVLLICSIAVIVINRLLSQELAKQSFFRFKRIIMKK